MTIPHALRLRHDGHRRRGFTLIEAMMAITIISISGAALMLAMESSLATSQSTVEETMAAGMAEQLLDEVCGQRYMAAGGDPYQYPLTASAWELSGSGRVRFDDTDDYHGFTSLPASDAWGKRLGAEDDAGGLRHPHFQAPAGLFATWRQKIQVYYVDEDDPSMRLAAGATSNYRAVDVSIFKTNPDSTVRLLARRTRVIAYVPSPN